jgi:hypothetical protein
MRTFVMVHIAVLCFCGWLPLLRAHAEHQQLENIGTPNNANANTMGLTEQHECATPTPTPGN